MSTERQDDIELARAMGFTAPKGPEQARERRDELIDRYDFTHPVFKRYNRLMSTGSSKADVWADKAIADLNREVGAMLVLLQLRGEGDTPAALNYIDSRTDISDEVLGKEMQDILTGYGTRRSEMAHKTLDKGKN